MQTYKKKGISIGLKELGDPSEERNHKLRLTKGAKKKGEKTELKRRRDFTGINQENITRGRKKII